MVLLLLLLLLMLLQLFEEKREDDDKPLLIEEDGITVGPSRPVTVAVGSVVFVKSSEYMLLI
jgi:hypothetical protein